MEQDYDVFTPTHPKTRADFIAVKGRDVVRVQVKTAQYNANYIQCRLDVNNARYTKEEVDCIFFILDERMWAVPVEFVEGMPSVCLGKINDPEYVARKDYSQFEIH